MNVHSVGIIVEPTGVNQPPGRQSRQEKKSIFIQQVITGFFLATLAPWLPGGLIPTILSAVESRLVMEGA